MNLKTDQQNLPSLSNRDYRLITKELTFVSLEPRMKRVIGPGKVFKEIMVDNFQNLTKDKPTDSVR